LGKDNDDLSKSWRDDVTLNAIRISTLTLVLPSATRIKNDHEQLVYGEFLSTRKEALLPKGMDLQRGPRPDGGSKARAIRLRSNLKQLGGVAGQSHVPPATITTGCFVRDILTRALGQTILDGAGTV